jgi:hypothetical protein
MTDQQTLLYFGTGDVRQVNTHARREALHAVYKMSRQIDENAEKPTPTDVLGDE